MDSRLTEPEDRFVQGFKIFLSHQDSCGSSMFGDMNDFVGCQRVVDYPLRGRASYPFAPASAATNSFADIDTAPMFRMSN